MKKLIQFELRKIFSKRLTQIALIILLLLFVLLEVSSYQNKYAFDKMLGEGTGKTAVEIDKAVADRYKGILTDEKVKQMMSDFKTDIDLHGMNAAYLYQNAVQSAAFARFSDPKGNWNGASVSDVFGKEKIRIGYIDGWLSAVQNMIKISFVLALVLIIMIAPVFCGEYGGTDNIILTSRYGRTKCSASKIAAGMIAALLVTAVIVLFNYLIAFIFYGIAGLDCSILFAPSNYTENYIPFNITCGALLGYQVMLAFTGAVSLTGITLLISAISKNQAAALAASAAVYFFPVILPVSEINPLFRFIGLLPLYHAQFISLMSIEQMGSGMLYAVFAVPAAFLFMIIGSFGSRRVFAKHQIL